MQKRNKHLKVVGDLKDRGSTKWQGLLLTEHVQLIRDWHEEDNYIPQPKLDEHDLQLIQEEMALAIQSKSYIIMHTWREGKITKHHGTIVEVDEKNRILKYEDPFKSHRLNLDEIVSVNLVD